MGKGDSTQEQMAKVNRTMETLTPEEMVEIKTKTLTEVKKAHFLKWM